jgi:hypothetical protein
MVHNKIPLNHGEKIIKKNKSYYTAQDLLNLEIKEIPMLWDPFIPQIGLVGLTGPSDTGKSTLLRQLAISICKRDINFLGNALNTRYGNVVCISTEDGREAVSVSISKQLTGIDPGLFKNLKFIFNEGNPKRTLTKILNKENVDLVVVDAWADLYAGNTNDVSQVRHSLNGLSGIAEKYGCAIIILHHTIKNSEYHSPNKNRLNGSQGIEAKLRALLEVRQGENNQRILSILKGNYISNDKKSKSILLKFDEERLLFQTTGLAIDKNTIFQREGYRFSDDPKLAGRIVSLKRDDNLSFEKIHDRLVSECGEDVPSLTTIKNIYYRFTGGDAA